jgi:hypothetical protein
MVVRFPELMEVLLNRAILVQRHLPMLESPTDTAAILARIAGADGAPALVSKPYGNGGGEVVQFAITADKAWSNWPDTYAYVVVLGELHKFAAKVHDTSAFNLTTRGTYRQLLDPGRYKADTAVRALTGDGEEHTYTAVAPAKEKPPTDKPPVEPPVPPAGQQPTTDQGPANLVLEVPMQELRTLGGFEVELRSHGDEIEKRMFARNPPIEESRLSRLLPEAFKRVYPQELHDRVDFLDENAGLGGNTGEGEIWRWLAAALLIGLLAESVLAWRFGRR